MKKIIMIVLLMFVFSISTNESVINSPILKEGTEQIDEISNNLKIVKDFKEIKFGETKKIEVNSNLDTTENINYESLNPDILSVDQEGNVTALSFGSGVIKVSLLGQEDSITLDVVKEDEDNSMPVQRFSIPSTYAHLNYNTHIEGIGWQDYVSDGSMSGTSGQSKRLEAIHISLDSSYTGGVEYRTHVEGIGWQDFVSDGLMSGTSGQSKRLEAIQIMLTGDISNYFDVYYRVHCQGFGWLGWAKNGESAGSQGYSYRLEAIEIMLKPKGEEVDSSDESFHHKIVQYSSNVEAIGWDQVKNEGETSGTIGQSRKIENIKVDFVNQDHDGDIEYQTFVEDKGWSDYSKNGEIAGITNNSKQLEAIKVRLTGEMEKYYDICYRVHVQGFGWLGWAKNDEIAGTIGYDYRIEAIAIMLIKKNQKIASDKPSNYKTEISYKTHVSGIGWMETKKNGETSGTTGESRGVEALQIKLDDEAYDSSVQYRSYISGIGWEDSLSDDEMISGTTGISTNIEAVQIKLKGELSKYIDIYYRVHAQGFGWLGWAKNGESSGSIGYDFRIEAIEIKLIKKEKAFSSTTPFYERTILYETHVSGIGWMETKKDGEVSGTTGQSRAVEAFRVKLANETCSGGVEYKSYIQGYGWENNFSTDTMISGTTGRSKNIEAIEIRLTGDISNQYDVYYRTHAQGFGWLGWAKNGEAAGSSGYNYRIEAIEIKMVKKGEEFDTLGDSYKMTVSGYFEISSKLNESLVFDASGSNTKDSTNVILYNNNNSINQIWNIIDLNNGYFSIVSSMNPNVYLTVNNGNVELNRFIGSDMQYFKLIDQDGYINIISKGNSQYISTTGNQSLSNVLTSNYVGNDSQLFKLIRYSGTKIYNGLDISSYNGAIDFNALSSNTNFAIIRAGFGNDEVSQDDARLLEYIRGCEENNIPYGLYLYSYALSVDEAISEANHILRLLSHTGDNFKLGVWFDMEDADGYKARHGLTTQNSGALLDICNTFGTIVQNAGYRVGIYASLSWLNGPLNNPVLDKFDTWVAHWNGPVTFGDARNHSTSYGKPYTLWQFCSDGHIPGVGGGASNVDLDLGYNIFD